MKKQIIYFMNGKKVERAVIAKRKNKKLKEKYVTEHIYYEAPLTKKEKEEKRLEIIRNVNAFRKLQEQREDLEARHG